MADVRGRDGSARADGARGHHGGRVRGRGYDRGSGRPSGPSAPFYAPEATRAAFGLTQGLQTRQAGMPVLQSSPLGLSGKFDTSPPRIH